MNSHVSIQIELRTDIGNVYLHIYLDIHTHVSTADIVNVYLHIYTHTHVSTADIGNGYLQVYIYTHTLVLKYLLGV